MDRMLIDSGLFGKGLVTIDTPKGIERYNNALVDLGCKPTELTEIHVDGIGFSWEVADEQGSTEYLSHGPSNICGIIISPDQENKPIQVPANTVLRPAMRDWFRRSKREAIDVTSDGAVRITFETNATTWSSAKDLLYFDELVIQASAGSITEVARDQKELVEQFNNTPLGWFNADLRKQIIQSGKINGDLRRRRLEIPDLRIVQVEDFWSRAFGGVFVLTAGKDKILVVEDDTQLEGLMPEKGERYAAFSLSQKKELLEHLLEEDLVHFDPKFFRAHPEELSALKDYLVSDIICRAEPDCDFGAMSISKRKAVIAESKSEQAEQLKELERFERANSGRIGKRQSQLSSELTLLLLRPTVRAGESAHPILRMLLLRLQENPVDLMRFYRYDKERFFSLFELWPSSKKQWAAKFVMAGYRPEMERRT